MISLHTMNEYGGLQYSSTYSLPAAHRIARTLAAELVGIKQRGDT